MTKPGINRRVPLDFFKMNVASRKVFTLSAFSFSVEILACLMCVMCSVSCTVPSSSGPVAITKVNPYHLADASRVATEDPMISFEKTRLLYGAVDSDDLKERYGNYFTVFWKTDQPGVPATIRLEYRQANTGPKIFRQEMEVASPKRKNATHLKVTGDDYETNGVVTQWKASIVQRGEVVTEYRSFLWK